MKEEQPKVEKKEAPAAKPKAAGPTKAPTGPVVVDEDLGAAMSVEEAQEKV